MSEPPGLHPGTLPLPQSWQPVKEEMNNKVNIDKVANCVNESYEFPVEEVDYENMDWNEDKEVITTTTSTHLRNNYLARQRCQGSGPNGQIQRTYKRHSQLLLVESPNYVCDCGIVILCCAKI